MTENHFWVSAHLPHPFKPNEFLKMFWKEQRQPGVWGPTLPLLLGLSLTVPLAMPEQMYLSQQPPRCQLLQMFWSVVDQRSPSSWNCFCSAPDEATTTVLVAAATTTPVAPGASTEVSPKRGSQGWSSSSDDDGNYQGANSGGQRLITPWISCSSQPPPPPDDRLPTTPASKLATMRPVAPRL